MSNNMFKNKGFTLVETLVSIILFTIALSALLALVKDSVTSASYLKNEVVGTYLAQEAVDYIRNVRDETIHTPSTPGLWSDFLTEVNVKGGCKEPSWCKLDVYALTNQIEPCTVIECGIMDMAGKKFQRRITTQEIAQEALLIKVEVSWNNGPNKRTKTLTYALYNWSL